MRQLSIYLNIYTEIDKFSTNNLISIIESFVVEEEIIENLSSYIRYFYKNIDLSYLTDDAIIKIIKYHIDNNYNCSELFKSIDIYVSPEILDLVLNSNNPYIICEFSTYCIGSRHFVSIILNRVVELDNEYVTKKIICKFCNSDWIGYENIHEIIDILEKVKDFNAVEYLFIKQKVISSILLKGKSKNKLFHSLYY